MQNKQRHEEYINACNTAIQDVTARIFQQQSVVSEAAGYSLSAGGKRVRGVFTLAVSDLLGGDRKAAECYSAAIEMAHAFSLIHDDLPCMDDDNLRRGKPSCHIVYGEANALLAGDLLALEAFEAVCMAPGESFAVLGAAQTLAAASGARGMIYGQELDMKYETEKADSAALYQIHTHKTGALLKASAHLGVWAAKQQPENHPAITEYIEKVGVVFQIVDDILDVTADQAQLGKPIGSDAQNHKTTFVTLYGLEESRKEVQRLTQEAVTALESVYGDAAAFMVYFAKQLAERVY